MDLLRSHIISGLGVTFKADNGKYWSVQGGGLHPEVAAMLIPKARIAAEFRYNIEAVKAIKDPMCKFWIEKVNGNTIRIKSDYKRLYLSNIDRLDNHHIEASKKKMLTIGATSKCLR